MHIIFATENEENLKIPNILITLTANPICCHRQTYAYKSTNICDFQY